LRALALPTQELLMLPAIINLVSFALSLLAGAQGISWLVVPIIALLSWQGYLRFPSGVRSVIADWEEAGRGRQIKIMIYFLLLPLLGFFYFMGTLLGG